MTGQDLRSLCWCLERRPEVFEAFHALVVGRLAQGTRNESFQNRRERTRAARIEGIRRRHGH